MDPQESLSPAPVSHTRMYVLGGLFILLFVSIGVYSIMRSSQKNSGVPPVMDAVPTVDGMSLVELDEAGKQGQLADVTGGESTGEMYVLRKKDTQTLEATIFAMLPTLPFGQQYEGWLVSDANPELFISLGALTEQKEIYSVVYTGGGLYSDYNTVKVTHEKTSDGKPETVILEGKLE